MNSKLNKKLKIAIIILAILFAESTILGLINMHGNTNFLFSPLGIVPTYSDVLIAKKGLEVKEYNYSWTTVYHSRTEITTYTLELDVTLYNYGKAFNCSAYTETEQGGAQDVWVTINETQVYSEYSIKQGENKIEIVREYAPTTDLTGFLFGLKLENPYTNIYRWKMSSGVGEPSYHQNSLDLDEHATLQNGYAFAADKLLSTFLYLWLPTLAAFFIGYSFYRIVKWVKEVNKLKANRKYALLER